MTSCPEGSRITASIAIWHPEAKRRAMFRTPCPDGFQFCSSMPRVVQEGRRVINNIKNIPTLYLVRRSSPFCSRSCTSFSKPANGSNQDVLSFSAKNLYLIEWFAISSLAASWRSNPTGNLYKEVFAECCRNLCCLRALTVVILHLLLNFIASCCFERPPYQQCRLHDRFSQSLPLP